MIAHLAALQIDLRQFEDATPNLRARTLNSRLCGTRKPRSGWLRRADTAYFCGDFRRPVRAPSRRKSPSIPPSRNGWPEQKSPRPAVRLGEFKLPTPSRPVSFSTCWPLLGPGTKPASDLSSVDGLQDVRERLWAEENGLTAIEFKATSETCFNIIERGIPFILTMVDAGYSHSQLVIGCDRTRNALWLTDGSDRRQNEAPLDILLERYASSGPRGLIQIPKAEASRLDGLDLPERALFDQLDSLQAAIHRHDRDVAVIVYESMKIQEAGHRLTRLARFAIARYDANPTLLLHAVDSLLALFPEDNTFLLSRLNVLRELGRKEERTETARRRVGKKDADPLFAHHYAQALLPDPSRHVEAERMMRTAVRQRPYAPAGYYILGNVLWEQRRFQEATDLYRFAASLEDRDEQFAEAYFRAARAVEQAPEAMRFLKGRYERNKAKLAGPARAMFYALSENDEMEAAFAALEACWTTPDKSSTERMKVASDALARRDADQLQRSAWDSDSWKTPAHWRHVPPGALVRPAGWCRLI